MAVPQPFLPIVRGMGFGVRPLVGPSTAGDVISAIATGLSLEERYDRLLERVLIPQLPAATDTVLQMAEGADLLVTHPHQPAGPIAAERVGLPWATFTIYVGSIPNSEHLPPGWPEPVAGPVAIQAAWTEFRALLARHDPALNQARADFGLAPVAEAFLLGSLSPALTLAACPTAFLPSPAGWPDFVQHAGFCYWDGGEGWSPAEELARFVEDGDPPVVFTLGTTLIHDPRGFYEVAARAADSAGCRALVLLGRYGETWGEVISDRLALYAYAPMSWAAPRARAAVHHGGFSTTAAVLRAGRPAVIVPRGFDQPFNAARVRDLGCGVVAEAATEEALAPALKAVLEDPGYRRRADGFAARLAGDDGPGTAADALERLLGAGASRSG